MFQTPESKKQALRVEHKHENHRVWLRKLSFEHIDTRQGPTHWPWWTTGYRGSRVVLPWQSAFRRQFED